MNVRDGWIAGCLLAVAMTPLCGCSNGQAAIGGTDTSAPDSARDSVRVQTVQPEATVLRRTTTQPVTVSPYHEADIEAKASGYLAKLNVDIGDHIQQGDVRAVLEIPKMAKDVEEKQAVTCRGAEGRGRTEG